MSRLTNHSALRTARPRVAVACAVLAVLTVLGTAPMPGDDAGSAETTAFATADPSEITFAELFQEMRAPESIGEGRGAVAIATPPEVPTVGDDSDGVAPPPAGPSLPQTVNAHRPDLVVRGVDVAATSQITETDGVAAAAAATTGEVTLSVPGGTRTVTVAAVDPGSFRPLTPEITAQEAAVWERIAAGDAAFTHDAGNRLTVPLGHTVRVMSGAPGTDDLADADDGVLDGAVDDALGTVTEVLPDGEDLPQLRIGAFASNGIPPVADALVSTDRADELGVDGPADVYVAVEDGGDLQQVMAALEALTGAAVELLEEPEVQSNEFGAVLVGSEARNFFEPFNYIDHGDGLITIDPDWVARNIASTTKLPVLGPGTVTCHRQMLIQLYGAFSEIEAAGLGPLIDRSQYGGCWVARHIDFNPSKPISMHGWGLAIDINVSTNQLGARPTMDPRIVEIFDRWGFVWGGRWNRPDGMHFEIGAVIDVPVPPDFFR